MAENKFYHSVYLKPELCKGCIHCLKRCPTQAIRVLNGKAAIIREFCIDCSECITHCPYHAKSSHFSQQGVLDKYEYNVALVDPSLYGQFNNLDDINIILTAFLTIGFDDVFEVAYAHEYLLEKTREYIDAHPDIRPVINSSCPTVDRLIRVRFPNLIENMLPLQSPAEIAAEAALKEAIGKTGLPREKIGIIYIAPCPAQVSYVMSPIGIEESDINEAIAMKELYKALLYGMNLVREHPLPLTRCGNIGMSLGTTCQEANGVGAASFLAADGIENVISVLNDIEDEKLPPDLMFAELKGCRCGCVGGVLNVENPYIARAKIKKMIPKTPETRSPREFFEETCGIDPSWTDEIVYEPVFRLGTSMLESMVNMAKVEEILQSLPQLDCGSCGAPTCRALAEDIVRGSNNASKDKCIYLMRGKYYKMIRDAKKKEIRERGGEDSDSKDDADDLYGIED